MTISEGGTILKPGTLRASLPPGTHAMGGFEWTSFLIRLGIGIAGCVAVWIIHKILFGNVFFPLDLYGDENVLVATGERMDRRGLENSWFRLHKQPGNSFIVYLFLKLNALQEVNLPRLREFFYTFNLFALTGIGAYAFRKNATAYLTYVLLVGTSAILTFFMTRIWADLASGLLCAIAALIFFRTVLKDRYAPLTYFLVGAICGLVLYFRSNLLILGPVLFMGGALVIFLSSRTIPLINVRRFVRAGVMGFALMLGFAATWGPWVMEASSKNDKLVLHPGFYEDDDETDMHGELKVWALSPPGAEWGVERTKETFRRTWERSVEAYEAAYPEEAPLPDTNFRQGGAVARVVGDWRRLGVDEDRWSEIVYRTYNQQLDEARANYTLGSHLHAYYRNFRNLFTNQNQFVSGALSKSEIEFQNETTWPNISKYRYTYGGMQIEPDIWPEPTKWQALLHLNTIIYILIMLGALGCVVRFAIAGTSPAVSMTVIACFFAFAFMITQHPGHGRYVMEFMPAALLGASAFFGGLLARFFRPKPA